MWISGRQKDNFLLTKSSSCWETLVFLESTNQLVRKFYYPKMAPVAVCREIERWRSDVSPGVSLLGRGGIFWILSVPTGQLDSQ